MNEAASYSSSYFTYSYTTLVTKVRPHKKWTNKIVRGQRKQRSYLRQFFSEEEEVKPFTKSIKL
jgi:hypothetical protein